MIKLDNVKVVFPRNIITIVEDDAFDVYYKQVNTKGRKIQIPTYSLKQSFRSGKRLAGLNHIVIRPAEVVLSISSKILGGKYFQLLSKKTIREAITNLNGVGIVHIPFASFIDNARVLSLEVTTDIDFIESVSSYIAALTIARLSDKMLPRIYKDETIIFEPTSRSQSRRYSVMIYNKTLQMESSIRRKNCTRLREFIHDNKIVTPSNRMRIETRLMKQRIIRKKFGIPDDKHAVALKRILDSKVNVNLSEMAEITRIAHLRRTTSLLDRDDVGLKLMNIVAHRKGNPAAILKELGELFIAYMAIGHPEFIPEYLKNISGKNISGRTKYHVPQQRRLEKVYADMVKGEYAKEADLIRDLMTRLRKTK